MRRRRSFLCVERLVNSIFMKQGFLYLIASENTLSIDGRDFSAISGIIIE